MGLFDIFKGLGDHFGTGEEAIDISNETNCPVCGGDLYHDEGFGFWECVDCDYEKYDDGYDTDDDIPIGCSLCGGPWPHCKISCKLYDD